MSHPRRLVAVLVSTLTALGSAVLVADVARADPATPVVYPSGSSATRIVGKFFDTCTAPSLSALAAWQGTSPYRGVNIYFGGRNRGCTQGNLNAAWVSGAAESGWSLVPTYVGDQPFCVYGTKRYRYSASAAASRGAADGTDAVARARGLGLLPGSALYADVEHYDRTASGCISAVRKYVSEWTRTLHRAGYLSGVYVHQDSGLRDLAASYFSTSRARPDAMWMARWDGSTRLTGWPTAKNSLWAEWQRAKQYQGDHDETWGGAKLNIDSDAIRGPVATVARSFTVTRTRPLYVRSGPTTTSSVIGTLDPGSAVAAVCQTRGQTIGSSPVWDRLDSGGWVTDYYVSTPSSTGYSTGLARCSWPGQVTTSGTLTTRSGPGTSYADLGRPLQPGALAYVACQQAGSLVGTTRVWDKLVDGRWVSDYYVSNRSNSTYSAPVPRCQ